MSNLNVQYTRDDIQATRTNVQAILVDLSTSLTEGVSAKAREFLRTLNDGHVLTEGHLIQLTRIAASPMVPIERDQNNVVRLGIQVGALQALKQVQVNAAYAAIEDGSLGL